MTIETFFEKFDLFADAPNAVEKMRELVLSLAVQGSLVPQDVRDEPIEAALRRMPAQSRPARYDSRSIARIEGVGALSVGPTVRRVPPGWANLPLVAIARIESGHTPSRTRADWWGGDVPWVGVVDARIHDGRTILTTSQHTNAEGLANSAARLLPAGTVCVSRTASVGYVTTLGVPMATSQDFVNWVPSAAVTSDWLRLVFTAEKPGFSRFSKGAVHQTIYFPEWLSMHTLLPPLAEQKRIVAKVDELMALCDRLEAQQQERAAKHADLARAALARFADEPTPANLSILFHGAFAVAPSDLRKSILAMAVRGRLVRQLQEDEPAAQALLQLDALKAARDAKARATESKQRSPTAEVEGPHDLPPAWSWTRTERLCEAIVDCPHSTPVFVPRGVLCVDTNSFKQGRLLPHKYRYVAEATYAGRITRLAPREGDIVFAREGSVGESVIVPAGIRCCLGQRVMLFRLLPGVLPEFARMALSEASSLDRLLVLHKGIGAKHVNVGDMRNALLPFPPLAEQRRIVAKVDQLMTLVDRLEAQLAESRTAAERLMEAVVAEHTRSPLDRDESPAVEEKPDPAAARIAAAGRFACYVVRRLHDDPEFGRTKLEKCNHLAESHCGVSLDRHAIRGAHGPVDFALLKEAERWADEQGGFVTHDPGNGERVTYAPGPALATHVAAAEAMLGDRKAEVDRVLDLLAPLTTRECEVRATAYAVWNDLLLAGQSHNDRDIIREARHNWHESKAKITDPQWFTALRWLEHHRIVPRGTGRPIARHG